MIYSEEVPFDKVRLMLFRDNNLMEGWVNPLPPESWKPCWGSSLNANGVIHTIEARKSPREFNITQTFQNGSEIKTRMSKGEFKWDIKSENDAQKTKMFRSPKGVIQHSENEDFLWKRQFLQNGDASITTINKKTKEMTRTLLKNPSLESEKNVGLKCVLSRSSQKNTSAGVNITNPLRNTIKAGIQTAIITEGFTQWDKLLSHPEVAVDAIQGAKYFYQDIKNLPPDQQKQAMKKVAIQVTKEVGKTFKDEAIETVEKGCGIARDLYEMDSETRSQFLKDVCVGTVKDLNNMKQSVKELIDLPFSDKISIAKNIGNKGIEKGKTLLAGAKKIYDAITSR